MEESGRHYVGQKTEETTKRKSVGNLRCTSLYMSWIPRCGRTYLYLCFSSGRFCHSVFDMDYKATIGVDFEVEKFSVLSVPFNLQM